jgi:microcystin-dependent protein
MPSHNHGGITGGSSQAMFINVTSAQDINDIGPSADNAAVSSDHTHTISSQGGGGAHNNLQPSAVVLKIIKT